MEWVFLTGALALSVWYGGPLLRASASPRRTLVKAGSVALLAAAALVGQNAVFVVLGLAACAVGDALLARETDAGLKAGLVAFLAGHLLYALEFVAAGGLVLLHQPLHVIVAQILVIVAAVAMVQWLRPGLKEFFWPVVVYSGAIALMAALALGLPQSPGLWLAGLGALAFMASDGLLAAERFRLPPDHPAHAWIPEAVWGLYWSGQALIAIGFLWPDR